VAGDWIKMRVDLAEDPAVIAMAATLQLTEPHIVGLLHKAWSWADKHTKNGHAKSVTLSWIDRYIGVTGFAESMVSAGWLAVDDGIKFPDFERHNGESAKKRASATERKRLERERHAEVTPMSRSKSDRSVTREEKRRDNPVVPFGFERFWSAYPKKTAKPVASKSWEKLQPDESLIAEILAAIERARATEQWLRDDGKFIPHPATWLNQRRWEDQQDLAPKRMVM
jgi:hypothetical protein